MELSAVPANKDIILALTSSTEVLTWPIYRIERKREAGEWLVWDGASFSNNGARF
jgi:hypothetical protein